MILALDMAFRNTGVLVIDKGKVVGHGLIKTEKSKNKQLRVSDDRFDCATQIGDGLREYIKKYKARGVIAEVPSGTKSASVGVGFGIAIGVLATVCAEFKLPFENVTQEQVKKAVCGKKSASKLEIMGTVAKAHGAEYAEKQIPIKNGKNNGKTAVRRSYTFYGETYSAEQFEHIADAWGVYEASKNSNVVRMFG